LGSWAGLEDGSCELTVEKITEEQA
jgi:hypothetical protein